MSVTIAALTLFAVWIIMAGEAILSAHNEAALRARGAVEPPGDVFATMRWAYPSCFLAMGIEGALTGPAPRQVLVAGLTIFGLAKALKISAISALGLRWSFRVLVLPDAPLVKSGPYRLLRHPNYVAIIGEFVGVALTVWAPVTGTIAILAFGWLIFQRMRVEDRALGRK
jgi:methyltransferase